MNEPTFEVEVLLEEKLRKMPMLQTKCVEAATAIAERARETAPVVSGAYRAGIMVQPFRGGARVLAVDLKSCWIEFGIPSKGVRPQFILRNAAQALGFTFKKSER